MKLKNIEKTGIDYSFCEDFDGYEIKTDDKNILLLISNHQSCCEDWGYFFTNDDTSDFIGSEILSVNRVDKSMDRKKLYSKYDSRGLMEYHKYEDDNIMDAGETVFIQIETSVGLLEFTAYNCHNGYYGHDVIISIGENRLFEISGI